jgi:hypothetical protein
MPSQPGPPSIREYVSFTDGSHLVSFDQVVDVMMQTGVDMHLCIVKPVKADWRSFLKHPKRIRRMKLNRDTPKTIGA